MPWIRGKYPWKILVGYDFSGTSDAALAWVNELGKVGKLETTFSIPIGRRMKPADSDTKGRCH